MRKTWAMAVKEIKQASRDPLTVVMLLGIPLFMLVLFGYALDFDVDNVSLALQDRDRSPESRRLVDAFVSTGRFRLVRNLDAGADPPFLTERGAATAILVIPDDFAADLHAGGTAEVQVIVDGTDSNTATTVLGYVSGIVSSVGQGRVGDVLRRAGAGEVMRAAIEYRPRVWYNPELESNRFLVPGLIAFILMLTTVLSTALSVVREKERGTLEQLRVAPLHTVQVLLGKLLPYLALSLASMLLILVGSWVLFEIRVEGPFVDLMLATLLFLVGGLAWGLLLSTLADSQAIAFQLGVLSALLPTLLLSGFVFPIRTMPEVLQWITHLVPARYYLVILRGIVIKGSSLAPFWDQMAFLSAYAGIVLALASLRFARETG